MFKAKRFWLVFFLAVSLLGLTGCNTTPSAPISGTVIEKDYDKASRYKVKKKWKTKSADWDITVREANGEEHEIDVSKQQYDKIRVGDRFTEGQN